MRRNNNNERSNGKGHGVSLWFKKNKKQNSSRPINNPTEAANVLTATNNNTSTRSLSGRSINSSRNSESRQKLEKVIGGIKAIEKTQKETAKRKVVNPWQNFVEEDAYIKFGGRRPDIFPEREKYPLEFEMEVRTPRGNPATWTEMEAAKVSEPTPSEDKDTPPTKWHKALVEHDWQGLEKMLEEAMREETAPEKAETSNGEAGQLSDDKAPGDSATRDEVEDISESLTQADSKGYTPLHLACVEKMPSKLTQKLLMLNKDAAIMKDKDGRLPIHLAALHHQSAGLLDRLVRSNINTLAVADSFGRTPLRYVVLQAEQRRDKLLRGMDWKYPVTQQQASWQTKQSVNWNNVHLLLKNMIRGKKLLSHANDKALVLEAVQCFAPPDVLVYMLTVGFKEVTNETTAVILFSLLFRFNYPIKVMEVALQMCSSIIPTPKLVGLFRQGLARHFNEGCMEIYREMSETKLSYRDELLEAGGVSALEEACKVWWDRLKFFLTVSTYQGLSYDQDAGVPLDQLVHAALRVPEVSPALVDFLLRLTPDSALTPSVRSGALPIHLACRNIKHKSIGKRMQIFKCILEGDPNLRRKEYRGRIPLHLALLADQPLPVIQAILALDTQTAGRRDPMTRLFPFQLAVLSPPLGEGKPDAKEKEINEDEFESSSGGVAVWSKIDTSFELLRACPVAILPQMYLGSGNLKGDINPITLHAINWCYEFSQKRGWVPCEYRIHQLKAQLSSKEKDIADEDLKERWNKAKQLIWQLYKIRSAKQKSKLKLGDDRYLLHAALMNGTTPPLLIAIILQQHKASSNKPVSGNTWYPVHLAARAQPYFPLPFEMNCVGLPSNTVLGLAASVTKPEILETLSGGKTPLEIALNTGRTWGGIQELVKLDPDRLLHPDSKTGQYPFQVAASKESSPPTHKIVRSRVVLEKWNTDPSSGAENAAKIKSYCKAYQKEKLTTVFELLRAKPTSILAAARNQLSTNEA